MSTDIKDTLKMNTQKRENIKLHLIHISLWSKADSVTVTWSIPHPQDTARNGELQITLFSSTKMGHLHQLLLLPLVLTMEKSVGEFTDSLLHSCPCSAVLPWESCCSLGQKFPISPPRRTNLLPLMQRELCLTDCYFKDFFYKSKQIWSGLQWILTRGKKIFFIL